MLQVGAFEAKNTFGSLLDRVEAGEEILITRHGRAGRRDWRPCAVYREAGPVRAPTPLWSE